MKVFSMRLSSTPDPREGLNMSGILDDNVITSQIGALGSHELSPGNFNPLVLIMKTV